MRRSFTLVELVLVITLTLVVVAGAIGGLTGFDAWRSGAAVRRVQSDLAYARQRALHSQRRMLCTFDTTAQTYELGQEAAPATGTITAAVLAHPLTAANWTIMLNDLASGLAVTGVTGTSNDTFGFNGAGLPVTAAGAAVSADVEVTFNSGAKVRVRQLTGLVEVVWP